MRKNNIWRLPGRIELKCMSCGREKARLRIELVEDCGEGECRDLVVNVVVCNRCERELSGEQIMGFIEDRGKWYKGR